MIMCELRYNDNLIAKHKKPSILLKMRNQLELFYGDVFELTFYNIDRLNYTE